MSKADALRRLILGLAQIILATITIVAWQQNAPTSLVVSLILITGLLVLCSILRWPKHESESNSKYDKEEHNNL